MRASIAWTPRAPARIPESRTWSRSAISAPRRVPSPWRRCNAELRGRNFSLLAGDRARFVGEAVAAVVADSRYAAEDARELIEVEYEPLASAQTLAAGAPAVHDDIPDNVAGRVTLMRGAVEAALSAAPRVASLALRIGRGGGQPMETRRLVVNWNAALGQLTVWASSQVPHQIRQFVADLLDLAPHQVRVIAPDVGGGFGAKLIVYPEDVLIPFIARRVARPVRWIEDRLEHMLAAPQEREQEHEVTVGFDYEGRLLALRDRFVHDTGAYTPRGLVVPLLTASMLTGPYRIPAVESSFVSRYTHRVPVTPYRGAGQPQAVFVIERVLDLVARETGHDRAQVRLANLVRAEDMPRDNGLPELPLQRPRGPRQRRRAVGAATARSRAGATRRCAPRPPPRAPRDAWSASASPATWS